MNTLKSHTTRKYTKLLVEGDSGTGKTTLLASLAQAGYRLRGLDYDNKMATLINWLEFMNIDCDLQWETLRDKTIQTETGSICDGPPRAYSNGQRLLDKWSDGSIPYKWGPEYVLFIDTLTTLSDSAFNWAKLMNNALSYQEGVPQKGVDPRQLMYAAQRAIMAMLNNLTSDEFEANVIVFSHIKYFNREGGITKCYPITVGTAIAPEIPTVFTSVVQMETTMNGGLPTRTLRTVSSPMIDLQNPVPFRMPALIQVPNFPCKSVKNTGLDFFFNTMKGT